MIRRAIVTIIIALMVTEIIIIVVPTIRDHKIITVHTNRCDLLKWIADYRSICTY